MLDLEIRKEISERVDAIQPVLIETLKEQIAIPSVVSYEAGEYPFGIKVHEAFIHFLQEAARLTCLRTGSILSTCMYGQGYGRGPATVP